MKKKKHHYVPKFYLRNFAYDANKKSICLYNLRNKKHVSGAAIKNQCYKDYFYGKDESVENAFSDIEGETSATFRSIIENGGLSLDVYLVSILTLYISLQHLRTVAAERMANDMANHTLKTGLKKKFDERIIDLVQIKMEYVSTLNVRLATLNSPMLWDLKFAFLINKSNDDFVTSDNPVVLANKLYERDDFRGDGIGFAVAGLIIILPISPRVSVMLFDGGVYSCTKGGKNEVVIKSQKDIALLNRFQILNAFENIYFSKSSTIDKVAPDAEVCAPLRDDSKMLVTDFVESIEPGSYVLPDSKIADKTKSGTLVLASRKALQQSTKLSFLKFRQKIKFYDDGSAMGAVRDFSWMEIVRSFGKLVEDNECTFNEFPEYVPLHPEWKNVGPWKKAFLVLGSRRRRR